MLVLKSKATRNNDGSVVYVEFLNATGNYSVDNVGGFGTPNPARNTLAILFYGNHKRVDADVLCVPEAYLPETVSSFTISINEAINGYLDYNLFAVPIFNPIGSYVDGDIVWDNQNPSAPFLKKRISSAWQLIDVEDLLSESSIVQVNGKAFPIPEAEVYRNELGASMLKMSRDRVYGELTEDEFKAANYDYLYVDFLFLAAVQNWCRGYYFEAQKNIEEISSFKKIRTGV